MDATLFGARNFLNTVGGQGISTVSALGWYNALGEDGYAPMLLVQKNGSRKIIVRAAVVTESEIDTGLEFDIRKGQFLQWRWEKLPDGQVVFTQTALKPEPEKQSKKKTRVVSSPGFTRLKISNVDTTGVKVGEVCGEINLVQEVSIVLEQVK